MQPIILAFLFSSHNFVSTSRSIFRRIGTFPKKHPFLLECTLLHSVCYTCVIISSIFFPYCFCLRAVSLSSSDCFYSFSFLFFPTPSPPLTEDSVSFLVASRLRFLVPRFIFLYLLHLLLLRSFRFVRILSVDSVSESQLLFGDMLTRFALERLVSRIPRD